jgi:hypothetical protein
MKKNQLAKKGMDWNLCSRVNITDFSKIKKEDKEAFLQMLNEQPEVWQTFGDMAHRVETLIFDKDISFALAEMTRRKLASMRDELGYETADEMEKLLIKQICINWLRSWLMESMYHEKLREGCSLPQALYWDKTLASAQRRFQRSIESLARVRKLLADAELKKTQARIKEQKANERQPKQLHGATIQIGGETYQVNPKVLNALGAIGDAFGENADDRTVRVLGK